MANEANDKGNGGAAAGWFEVDKVGLGKLCERRGKAFVVNELISNAWDTGAKHVDVRLTSNKGGLTAHLRVEDDDPDGFRNLSHAYTLFAESEKKPDATKRGRFNLGEKLVLALCEEAAVSTTTGVVTFTAEGGRREAPAMREAGSTFDATVRMTTEEVAQVSAAVRTLLPPEGVETIFNGEALSRREPVSVVDAVLHTEIADSSGVLRRTERKTKVEIHEPMPGEAASIYEMGIPVVETGDRYHVNVMQKCPLNTERDNVLPAFLRDIRAVVLNAVAGLLKPEEASETWVSEGLSDDKITAPATKVALLARFGAKAVIADPSDREAENRAKGAGYTVIPPGALSKDAWKNVRRHEAAKPAGQLFPTPLKAEAEGRGPRSFLDEKDWTPGIRAVAAYCGSVIWRLLGKSPVTIRISNDAQWNVMATWARLDTVVLTFNVAKLGRTWFAPGNRAEINALLLHEMSHDVDGGDNHLCDAYHDEAFRLGAALAELYLAEPAVVRLLQPETAAPARESSSKTKAAAKPSKRVVARKRAVASAG